MGLVSRVFSETKLNQLSGSHAIGHTRYSTTGTSKIENAQPIAGKSSLGSFSLAHNGNLTNSIELRKRLERDGHFSSSTKVTDSKLATLYIAQAATQTWEQGIGKFLETAEGAYSMVMLTPEAMYAFRDPNGFRPLSLGQVNGEGWAVASETCAFRTIKISPMRDITPGEVVRIDKDGYKTVLKRPQKRRAFCIFEFVYLARPDSKLEGEHVDQVRQELGAALAREAPTEADTVIGVPEAALHAALGYANQSGIPYSIGFAKNRYIDRTFIQPDQRLRENAVELKLNPLPKALHGKRVVMVDDSIVRGTTSGPTVQMLRDAGALEVHVRITAPPIKHPCYMGVDMKTEKELIGSRKSVEGIRKHIGADSLAYLSYEAMLEAANKTNELVCGGCFTGKYPISVKDAAVETKNTS